MVQSLLALLTGITCLVRPQIFLYAVSFYLIIIGSIGLVSYFGK